MLITPQIGCELQLSFKIAYTFSQIRYGFINSAVFEGC